MDMRTGRCLAVVAAAFVAATGNGVEVRMDASAKGIAAERAAKSAAKDIRRMLEKADGVISFAVDPSLESQAWRVSRTGRGEIEIGGRDGVGVAYGAYSMLEDVLGCRWYTPECEKIPQDVAERFRRLADGEGAKVIALGRPAILDREMYVGNVPNLGVWRFRNRENHRASNGGSISVGSPRGCHTFATYADYLKKNGGVFCGKRNFCLSAETNRVLVAERMLRYIREDRAKGAGMTDYEIAKVYELSQDDGGNGFDCGCDGCRGLYAEAGSWSGPNLLFCDAVAKRVAKEFPDVRVRTFAYSYTERSPTNEVRVSDSLMIRYCRSFLFQPLTAATDNGRTLKEWSRHVKFKHVWGYWRSYEGPHLPTVKPLDEMADEMRFCREQDICGYFAEAEDPGRRSFAELQHWLFLKLAEDPDRDAVRLAEEFCEAYYGAAAKPLLRLYGWVADCQKAAFAEIDPQFIASTHSGHLAMYTQRSYLTRRFFEGAERLLADAENAVKGEATFAARVAKERSVFDSAKADRFGKRPVPKELAGREYEEWQAKSLEGGVGKVVADPDSVSGFALTCDKVSHRLPYVAGVYDPIVRKIAERKLGADELPQDEKYHLLRLGRCPLICESRVYYDWSWGWSNWLPAFTPNHDDREIWISVKLTGPTYVKGSTRKDGIFIERIFIVR